MTMIEKAEEEFLELNRKREVIKVDEQVESNNLSALISQVILKDKSKIEEVIQELDLKKSQALQATWIKVNQDFGSIFSTLLPV